MILADTSVWVEFFRRGAKGRAANLAALLDRGAVIVCGPVAAELLAGAEGEVAERLSRTLDSLPWAELDHAAWQALGALAGQLRRAGERLPLTDLLIAVAAAKGTHPLWSLDADFERIAASLEPLQLYLPPA